MGAFNYIWSWLCKRVYNRVDHNKDGLIDALEIEVRGDDAGVAV